jgi:signal transduction histidine kinase
VRFSLRNIAIVVAFWTFLGCYSAIQAHVALSLAGRKYSWGWSFFSELTYAYIACILTPVVVALARRFPIERRHWLRNLCIHLAIMPVFSAIVKFTYDVIVSRPDSYLRKQFSYAKMFQSIVNYSDFGAILYGLTVALYYTLEYYRRYQQESVRAAQLQTQLAQAQVQTLKMQLHPHFLFNTLHSISALVHDDPDSAESMIARLSDLLRRALDQSATQEIPLRDELDFLNLYLDIERIRFEDRLKVEYDIDPGVLDALVPNMILQPLVENAIRHGISSRTENGRICISAKKRANDLLLRVEDNGSGMPARAVLALKEGVGLTSTRGRLERLYGSGQRLQLEAPSAGGLIARIVLPFATAGEWSHAEN